MLDIFSTSSCIYIYLGSVYRVWKIISEVIHLEDCETNILDIEDTDFKYINPLRSNACYTFRITELKKFF